MAVGWVDNGGVDENPDSATVEWLSSRLNPPVRYLTARDLAPLSVPARELQAMREAALGWPPLRQILGLQLEDGSFPYGQKTPTAQPTFWALCLMARCGMDISDEPVRRIVGYLEHHQMGKGALSYTGGGSGVLPCYAGVVTAVLIEMGASESAVVQGSIQWLVDHQRFDHKTLRAGGDATWPYKAPTNYGCWETVSCYHGVAGAFRAFAALPPAARSADVNHRIEEALEYLRLHRLYKGTAIDRPLFRHMTEFFLIGDYRSGLIDMLHAVADADSGLIHEDWVAGAVDDVERTLDAGRVTLVKNYGRKLIDPIPFEPIGEPSRFLTYEWLTIRRAFGMATPDGAGRTAPEVA